MTPMMRHEGLVRMFTWQLGPHRQGCGILITQAVAELTGWNTRAESFTIGIIIFVALLAAFALKRRLYGRWDWSDVTLPLLFLTPVQFETFFGTPNPAHSAVPLLLIMLYCLLWTVKRRAVRYGGIVVTNFLLIYTGFGFFIGVITPLLLAVDCWKARRTGQIEEFRWAFIALIFSLVSIASFFYDYSFEYAKQQNSHSPLWKYPFFVALMLGHFFGVHYRLSPYITSLVGSGLLLLILGVCSFQALLWLRTESLSSRILLVLTLFTLLFCFNTAYGRLRFGMVGSQSPRYATLLIAVYFGLYMHGLTLRRPPARVTWLAVALVMAAWSCLPQHQTDHNAMTWYHDGKVRWRAAYLKTGDIHKADRLAHFIIHPYPDRIQVPEKLAWLRRHHWNLFMPEN